jgi:hypothetical protein
MLPENFTYEEWQAASDEEKTAFIESAVELSHKRQYEAVFADADIPCPPWESLTEEQREHIRQENTRYAREMQALGDQIYKMANP